jgi:hypothetical protein
MGYSLFLLGQNNVISKIEPGEMQVGLVSDYLAVPNEQCEDVAERFPNFVFRPLRDEEIIEQLIVDVETYEDHRVHAFKYLKSRYSAAALNTTFRPVCEALVRHKFFEVKERD